MWTFCLGDWTFASLLDQTKLALHVILQHLESPGAYARMLFVDFSSAFNTIHPALLWDKLSLLNVPVPICQWITNFLTDRRQHMSLGKNVLDIQTIQHRYPPATILSSWLSLQTTVPRTGLILGGDKSAYRREVDSLLSRCTNNNLELKAQKTVEMIVDFQYPPSPLWTPSAGYHHHPGPQEGVNHQLTHQEGPADDDLYPISCMLLISLLLLILSLYTTCFMPYVCTESIRQILSNVKPLHLHGNKYNSDNDALQWDQVEQHPEECLSSPSGDSSTINFAKASLVGGMLCTQKASPWFHWLDLSAVRMMDLDQLKSIHHCHHLFYL